MTSYFSNYLYLNLRAYIQNMLNNKTVQLERIEETLRPASRPVNQKVGTKKFNYLLLVSSLFGSTTGERRPPCAVRELCTTSALVSAPEAVSHPKERSTTLACSKHYNLFSFTPNAASIPAIQQAHVFNGTE